MKPAQKSRRYVRLTTCAVVLVAVGICVWVFATKQSAPGSLETITLTNPVQTAAPIMCPWRTPAQDMAAFFPGSTRYQTNLLVLSPFRNDIQKRIGTRDDVGTNQLYIHRIFRQNMQVGAVLPKQFAGTYGAAEIVVAVDPDLRVAGVKLQRLREPEAIAKALMDEHWLHTFQGRSPGSEWHLGQDIGDVPASARPSAAKIVTAVRSLMIEYQAARDHGEG